MYLVGTLCFSETKHSASISHSTNQPAAELPFTSHISNLEMSGPDVQHLPWCHGWKSWVPWHWQKQTLLVSRNVSATSSKAGTVRNASHLELFHIGNTLCTALKPKCRTEILVAGKGMRQWKPQGQLRTISPWDTWYNSSYNTTPLKINSIKLLYSYVDSFHAVAASPYCTSVSTYKQTYTIQIEDTEARFSGKRYRMT